MLTLCVSLKLDQNKLYVVYSFPFQTDTTYYIERSYAVPEKKNDSYCLRCCFNKIIESQALSLVNLLNLIFMYQSKFYKLNAWFCRNSSGILKREL